MTGLYLNIKPSNKARTMFAGAPSPFHQTTLLGAKSIPDQVNESQQALRRAVPEFPYEPAKLLSGVDARSIVKHTSLSTELSNRLFDCLVALKVAVSKYAMHIAGPERFRLFTELDSVLNTEDWHEEDDLPKTGSFVSFLKWMIYSKSVAWTSLGVSDQGTILVAWRSPHVLLTANFVGLDSVQWTANVETKNGSEQIVGKTSLQYFAKQFEFLYKTDG